MTTETTAPNQADASTVFLRAARAGQLDKVLALLNQDVDINVSNANGLNALHLASKDGHVEVVKELLSRGASIDAATKKGNTALHIASLAGQEDIVRILVQHGAQVNIQSQNGFTPLYMAAQENHDGVVKFLLANGANQSLATEDGFTPLAVSMQQGHEKVVALLLEADSKGRVRLPALHIAAKKDDVKAATLLLENEHNPDVTSKSGFTPLHIAAHYGNESIAKLLLAKGADVNCPAKHNICPLHVAAKWGKENMVTILCDNGGNVEARTRDGLTPLHCAARSGHDRVVELLLDRGAPISSKSKNGLAALHMAAQGDHVDAARALLTRRAPVDDVTVDYLTALHVAAHCGHARVAKLLLDRNADPNARALNGFTPLHIACKKNRIKVVELLLKYGASISATTESGLTPLHVASFMGAMNIVIYLLQHGASPDVPTVRGETALHLASRANQTDIIRILLRNGACVDAVARERQTPLHIASRLGNSDIVVLLLQHGADINATTADHYNALHIAAKQNNHDVAAALIEHGATITATTKKGFTPLHLAAKYGNLKVAQLLLAHGASPDLAGKNGVTPLHVAAQYDQQPVALTLLEKGADAKAVAKNGHTPLHIAARKNQMEAAATLLEYGAVVNSESKSGYTPLHLAAQLGHTEMCSLLLEHGAKPNGQAQAGLAALHLAAQEDHTSIAALLMNHKADVDIETKGGYTPLHIASHFGQANMVRFLLDNGASVKAKTTHGYSALHHAAQQGHINIVNILLDHKADANDTTNNDQTPLDIATKLGYVTIMETLKEVSEPGVSADESNDKYKVVAPETMKETFISDSEEEGGEEILVTEQSYRYLTADDMKSLGDASLHIDVTRDERADSRHGHHNIMEISQNSISGIPNGGIDYTDECMVKSVSKYSSHPGDGYCYNVDPTQPNFLVSFLADARGCAVRGVRGGGVRVVVPPNSAQQPTRITCRYLKPSRINHMPPLMEGEALASRVLEMGPVAAKFLGPVIIEVPHYASLRNKEREIVILRSDNGSSWREHTLEATDEILQDILHDNLEIEENGEDTSTGQFNRVTRILTHDFPQYFAVISRIRQEVHAIGPEGGMVSSTVVPQVQAVFPQGALTKKIKVGLQAQIINSELTAKLLGRGVAVSPVVTVEPRRRKFHKAITLSMPAPRPHTQGMTNQYTSSAPTLRLLCSISGGTNRAHWEDVTDNTPLTFVNDCVSFTTTVSARYWLIDCRNVGDATKMATELYREAIHVPFMARFIVWAKRIEQNQALIRMFCVTDDKEEKTLEKMQRFTQVAKSRDVEVLEGKPAYVEFAGNLIPIAKTDESLTIPFRAFKENRAAFPVMARNDHSEASAKCILMREPKPPKGEPTPQPICVLNITVPDEIIEEIQPPTTPGTELHFFSKDLQSNGDVWKNRLSDPSFLEICNLLGCDWVPLAYELGVDVSTVNHIQAKRLTVTEQAQLMLKLWKTQSGSKARDNSLELALMRIGREDVIMPQSDQSTESRIQRNIYQQRQASEEMELARIDEKSSLQTQELIVEKSEPMTESELEEHNEAKYSPEEKSYLGDTSERERTPTPSESSEEDDEVKRSVAERKEQITRKLSTSKIPASKQKKEIREEIIEIKTQIKPDIKKFKDIEEKAQTVDTTTKITRGSSKTSETVEVVQTTIQEEVLVKPEVSSPAKPTPKHLQKHMRNESMHRFSSGDFSDVVVTPKKVVTETVEVKQTVETIVKETPKKEAQRKPSIEKPKESKIPTKKLAKAPSQEKFETKKLRKVSSKDKIPSKRSSVSSDKSPELVGDDRDISETTLKDKIYAFEAKLEEIPNRDISETTLKDKKYAFEAKLEEVPVKLTKEALEKHTSELEKAVAYTQEFIMEQRKQIEVTESKSVKDTIKKFDTKKSKIPTKAQVKVGRTESTIAHASSEDDKEFAKKSTDSETETESQLTVKVEKREELKKDALSVEEKHIIKMDSLESKNKLETQLSATSTRSDASKTHTKTDSTGSDLIAKKIIVDQDFADLQQSTEKDVSFMSSQTESRISGSKDSKQGRSDSLEEAPDIEEQMSSSPAARTGDWNQEELKAQTALFLQTETEYNSAQVEQDQLSDKDKSTRESPGISAKARQFIETVPDDDSVQDCFFSTRIYSDSLEDSEQSDSRRPSEADSVKSDQSELRMRLTSEIDTRAEYTTGPDSGSGFGDEKFEESVGFTSLKLDTTSAEAELPTDTIIEDEGTCIFEKVKLKKTDSKPTVQEFQMIITEAEDVPESFDDLSDKISSESSREIEISERKSSDDKISSEDGVTEKKSSSEDEPARGNEETQLVASIKTTAQEIEKLDTKIQSFKEDASITSDFAKRPSVVSGSSLLEFGFDEKRPSDVSLTTESRDYTMEESDSYPRPSQAVTKMAPHSRLTHGDSLDDVEAFPEDHVMEHVHKLPQIEEFEQHLLQEKEKFEVADTVIAEKAQSFKIKQESMMSETTASTSVSFDTPEAATPKIKEITDSTKASIFAAGTKHEATETKIKEQVDSTVNIKSETITTENKQGMPGIMEDAKEAKELTVTIESKEANIQQELKEDIVSKPNITVHKEVIKTEEKGPTVYTTKEIETNYVFAKVDDYKVEIPHKKSNDLKTTIKEEIITVKETESTKTIKLDDSTVIKDDKISKTDDSKTTIKEEIITVKETESAKTIKLDDPTVIKDDKISKTDDVIPHDQIEILIQQASEDKSVDSYTEKSDAVVEQYAQDEDMSLEETPHRILSKSLSKDSGEVAMTRKKRQPRTYSVQSSPEDVEEQILTESESDKAKVVEVPETISESEIKEACSFDTRKLKTDSLDDADDLFVEHVEDIPDKETEAQYDALFGQEIGTDQALPSSIETASPFAKRQHMFEKITTADIMSKSTTGSSATTIISTLTRSYDDEQKSVLEDTAADISRESDLVKDAVDSPKMLDDEMKKSLELSRDFSKTSVDSKDTSRDFATSELSMTGAIDLQKDESRTSMESKILEDKSIADSLTADISTDIGKDESKASTEIIEGETYTVEKVDSDTTFDSKVSEQRKEESISVISEKGHGLESLQQTSVTIIDSTDKENYQKLEQKDEFSEKLDHNIQSSSKTDQKQVQSQNSQEKQKISEKSYQIHESDILQKEETVAKSEQKLDSEHKYASSEETGQNSETIETSEQKVETTKKIEQKVSSTDKSATDDKVETSIEEIESPSQTKGEILEEMKDLNRSDRRYSDLLEGTQGALIRIDGSHVGHYDATLKFSQTPPPSPIDLQFARNQQHPDASVGSKQDGPKHEGSSSSLLGAPQTHSPRNSSHTESMGSETDAHQSEFLTEASRRLSEAASPKSPVKHLADNMTFVNVSEPTLTGAKELVDRTIEKSIDVIGQIKQEEQAVIEERARESNTTFVTKKSSSQTSERGLKFENINPQEVVSSMIRNIAPPVGDYTTVIMHKQTETHESSGREYFSEKRQISSSDDDSLIIKTETMHEVHGQEREVKEKSQIIKEGDQTKTTEKKSEKIEDGVAKRVEIETKIGNTIDDADAILVQKEHVEQGLYTGRQTKSEEKMTAIKDETVTKVNEVTYSERDLSHDEWGKEYFAQSPELESIHEDVDAAKPKGFLESTLKITQKDEKILTTEAMNKGEIVSSESKYMKEESVVETKEHDDLSSQDSSYKGEPLKRRESAEEKSDASPKSKSKPFKKENETYEIDFIKEIKVQASPGRKTSRTESPTSESEIEIQLPEDSASKIDEKIKDLVKTPDVSIEPVQAVTEHLPPSILTKAFDSTIMTESSESDTVTTDHTLKESTIDSKTLKTDLLSPTVGDPSEDLDTSKDIMIKSGGSMDTEYMTKSLESHEGEVLQKSIDSVSAEILQPSEFSTEADSAFHTGTETKKEEVSRLTKEKSLEDICSSGYDTDLSSAEFHAMKFETEKSGEDSKQTHLEIDSAVLEKTIDEVKQLQVSEKIDEHTVKKETVSAVLSQVDALTRSTEVKVNEHEQIDTHKLKMAIQKEESQHTESFSQQSQEESIVSVLEKEINDKEKSPGPGDPNELSCRSDSGPHSILETESDILISDKEDSSKDSPEIKLRKSTGKVKSSFLPGSAGDRRSASDVDGYSSSDSHYQSFEHSDSSRPLSSDVEVLVTGQSTGEFATALSSTLSSKSQKTSKDYFTAVSSMASRDSMKSLDSESSGHLASIDISDASETLVPSASELKEELMESGNFTDQEGDILKEVQEKRSLVRDLTSDDEDDHGISDQEPVGKMKRSHEMRFQPKEMVPEHFPLENVAESVDIDEEARVEPLTSSKLETQMVEAIQTSSSTSASTATTIIEKDAKDDTIMEEIIDKCSVKESFAAPFKITEKVESKRQFVDIESQIIEKGTEEYDIITGKVKHSITTKSNQTPLPTPNLKESKELATPLLTVEEQCIKHVIKDIDVIPFPITPKPESKREFVDLEDQIIQQSPEEKTKTIDASISFVKITDSKESKFYPLESKQSSASSVKSSALSQSSESTDAGREYVLDDIYDLPEISETKDSKSEYLVTMEEKTEREQESPLSDEFEMVDKPSEEDDFVVIEEVAKEADESDGRGKILSIKATKYEKKHDEEVEAYLSSLSKPSESELSSSGSTTDDDDQRKVREAELADIEAGRKWIQMQFEGDPRYDYERPPLEDIKEEEMTDFDASRIGSLSSQKESVGSFGSMRNSYGSLSESEGASRRRFMVKGDPDEVSISSLQEFENLERAMMEQLQQTSSSSQDSLNGSLPKRYLLSKSLQGDDISVSSLKEFEGLESACLEAMRIEVEAKKKEELLATDPKIVAGSFLEHEKRSYSSSEGSPPQKSDSKSGSPSLKSGSPGQKSESPSSKAHSDSAAIRKLIDDQMEQQKFTKKEPVIVTVKKHDSKGTFFTTAEPEETSEGIQEICSKVTTYSCASEGIPESLPGDCEEMMQIMEQAQNKSTKSTIDRLFQDPSLISEDIKGAIDIPKSIISETKDADIDISSSITSTQSDVDSTATVIDRTSKTSLTINLDKPDDLDLGLRELSPASGRSIHGVTGMGKHFTDPASSWSGQDEDMSSSGSLSRARADLMLGSTDSLEATSSNATRATYNYEVDTPMTGSLTSGGSHTMVSSLDTLDPVTAFHVAAHSALESADYEVQEFEDENERLDNQSKTPRAKERTVMFDSTDTLSAVSGDSVREAGGEKGATFFIGDTPIVRGEKSAEPQLSESCPASLPREMSSPPLPVPAQRRSLTSLSKEESKEGDNAK